MPSNFASYSNWLQIEQNWAVNIWVAVIFLGSRKEYRNPFSLVFLCSLLKSLLKCLKQSKWCIFTPDCRTQSNCFKLQGSKFHLNVRRENPTGRTISEKPTIKASGELPLLNVFKRHLINICKGCFNYNG